VAKNQNKAFVKMVMATSTLALVVLFVAMFWAIRVFTAKTETLAQPKIETTQTTETLPVDIYADILGVIESKEDNLLYVWDIQKHQTIIVTLTESTEVRDIENNYMPREALTTGEIVSLRYAASEDKLIRVQVAERRFKKTGVQDYVIDRGNQTIQIGSKLYEYDGFTFVWQGDKKLNTYLIGEYDTLTVLGVENTIYTIILEGSQGYLQLENLPTREGKIEIGQGRLILLSEINDIVPLPVGQQSVVVTLDGYMPYQATVKAISGETVKLDLSDMELLTTQVQVTVKEASDYTLYIDGKIYSADKPIVLPYGNYELRIQAEGYEDFEAALILEKPVLSLMVAMQSLSDETTTTTSAGTETVSGSENSYSIWLSTEPSGARVLIDGIYKGQSPLHTSLGVGDYTVTFEKEGYETYITSLIIDNSDNQHNYYYVLTPTS
jgi:hypothetical protein